MKHIMSEVIQVSATTDQIKYYALRHFDLTDHSHQFVLPLHRQLVHDQIRPIHTTTRDEKGQKCAGFCHLVSLFLPSLPSPVNCHFLLSFTALFSLLTATFSLVSMLSPSLSSVNCPLSRKDVVAGGKRCFLSKILFFFHFLRSRRLVR